MKKVLMVLGLAALTCSAETTEPITPPEKPVNVLFLGDSLSDGPWNVNKYSSTIVGDTGVKGGGNGEAHVEKLQRKLNEDAAWFGKVKIFNYAVHGDSIPNVIKRLDKKCGTSTDSGNPRYWAEDPYPGNMYGPIFGTTRQYDWAFIFLGQNDTKIQPPAYTDMFVSEEDMRSGLEDLIGRLRAQGVSRIVVYSSACPYYEWCVWTQPNVKSTPSSNRYELGQSVFGREDCLAKYNAIVQDLVNQHSDIAEYCDVYTPLKAEGGNMTNLVNKRDGVHFNQAGHERMAQLEFAYLTGKTTSDIRIYNGADPGQTNDWYTMVRNGFPAQGNQIYVKAGESIGITNGTFNSWVDDIATTNAIILDNGATFSAFAGSKLVYLPGSGISGKSFGLYQNDTHLVLDGTTFDLAVRNSMCFFSTGTKGPFPVSCSWDVKDSTVDYSRSMAQAYYWINGTDNRMTIVDSTLNLGSLTLGRQFMFEKATNCVFEMTRSSLKKKKQTGKDFPISFSNTIRSTATFRDATIVDFATVEFGDSASDNVVEFFGDDSSVSVATVTMDGVGNTLRLATAKVDPAVTLSGKSNCLAVAHADYDFNRYEYSSSVWPIVALESGSSVSNQYLRGPGDFSPFVDNSTIDIRGGELKVGRYLAFDGENKTIRVRDGGTLSIGLDISKTGFDDVRNALRFSGSGFTLSIEEDGVVESHTAINRSRSVADYKWVNCPNSLIVFKGSNPQFKIASSQDANNGLTLGTADDTEMTDPVKLRFEIQGCGYGENQDERAAIQSTGSKRVAVYANQPIEIVDLEQHAAMEVPLVYSKGGFATTMDAKFLAALKRHATLPPGASFVVHTEPGPPDEDGNPTVASQTLCVYLPGNKGFSLFFW